MQFILIDEAAASPKTKSYYCPFFVFGPKVTLFNEFNESL